VKPRVPHRAMTPALLAFRASAARSWSSHATSLSFRRPTTSLYLREYRGMRATARELIKKSKSKVREAEGQRPN